MPTKKQFAFRILVALAVLAGSAVHVWAAEPALIFKMGAGCAEGDTRDAMANALADAITSAGEKGISVEVICYPEPDANRQMLDDMLAGGLDIVLLDDWALGQFFPEMGILGRPLLFANPYQADMFYYGEGGKRAGELSASSGFKIMGWLKCPPPNIFADRPLLEPSDFKGLRIATESNPALLTVLTTLGAEYARLPLDGQVSALRSESINAIQAEATAFVAAMGEGTVSATQINTGISLPYLAICCSNRMMAMLKGENERRFLSGIEQGQPAASQSGSERNSEATRELLEKGFTANNLDIGAVLVTANGETGIPQMQGDRILQQAVVEVHKPRDNQ